MRFNYLLAALLLTLCSCNKNCPDKSDTIVSMQVIDRNGFTETISSKERLKPYQESDFLAPQPYQKVLRVYGRSKAGSTASKITSYHPNGQIWQYLEVADGRAHGAYREWFANGQKRAETQLIEGLADINDLSQSSWIFEGKSSIWDDQGNLLAEFHYDKGVLNTPSFHYHPNGKLHKSIPYQNGVIEGTVLIYDPEGDLIEKSTYLHGKKQGECLAFWGPNRPLFTETYEEGLLLTASYFNLNGDLISTIEEGRGKQAQFEGPFVLSLTDFENGIPCGLVKNFRPDGSVLRTFHIKDSKKNGEEIEYYPSSNLQELKPKLSIYWHDDAIQGQVKTWYDNGVQESQREINNNKKQGMSVAWYNNGDLMLVEEYQNDLLIKGSYHKKGDKTCVSRVEEGKGVATLYTSEGIFWKKIAYEKGKPLLPDESLQ